MRARVHCRGPSWRGMLGRLPNSDNSRGSPAAMFCREMDLQPGRQGSIAHLEADKEGEAGIGRRTAASAGAPLRQSFAWRWTYDQTSKAGKHSQARNAALAEAFLEPCPACRCDHNQTDKVGKHTYSQMK